MRGDHYHIDHRAKLGEPWNERFGEHCHEQEQVQNTAAAPAICFCSRRGRLHDPSRPVAAGRLLISRSCAVSCHYKALLASIGDVVEFLRGYQLDDT